MDLDGDYAPSPRGWVRKQVELYERTGGMKGNTQVGRPIVVVTMRGAASGKIRKVALMRVEHQGEYALVASDGGSRRHPLWYHNLLAHPEVELQDGDHAVPMKARLTSGAERAEWWPRCVEAFPNYAVYQTKTQREIPVFVLTPA